MDLTFDLEGYRLNIRVAGIIVHNNKILFHKNLNKQYYALIGGRIKMGENSKNALKRELEEELGKQVNIQDFLGIIENFFVKDDVKYHELLFIYKAEFKSDKDKQIEDVLENKEGKSYLKYHWVDFEKLDEYKIVPNGINKILSENKYPFSKILNDDNI